MYVCERETILKISALAYLTSLETFFFFFKLCQLIGSNVKILDIYHSGDFSLSCAHMCM